MGTHRLTLSVSGTPRAAADARRRAVTEIRSWELPAHGDTSEALDSVELVISELLTNAVQHAGPGPISLSLELTEDALLVEVCDASATLPRPAHPDVDDEHGRGLFIVDAVATRHGVEPTPAGKRCWAEIALPSRNGNGHRPRLFPATIITGRGGRPDSRAPCTFITLTTKPSETPS